MQLRVVSVGVALLIAGCGQGATATPVVQTNVVASPAAIGASPAPSGPIQFARVQITDQDATVELQNTGGSNAPTTVDLGGWAIQVGTTRVTLPADARIAPSQSLLLHTGPAVGGTPSGSPSAFASPSASVIPVASPVGNAAPVNVYLDPQQGQTLRAALRPGVDVDLVDAQNTLRSRYAMPRS
jgi:hypothetical protein